MNEHTRTKERSPSEALHVDSCVMRMHRHIEVREMLLLMLRLRLMVRMLIHMLMLMHVLRVLQLRLRSELMQLQSEPQR